MRKEREFLHAIASPLATAQLLLCSALEDLVQQASSDPQKTEDLTDAGDALEEAIKMLKERREELVQAGF